jgi:transcriptional regulator with XRE-family HTH domain
VTVTVVKVLRRDGIAWRTGRARRVDYDVKASPEYHTLTRLIGEAVRRAREARDVPAAELAAAIGVSESVIRRWESGAHAPTLASLLAIAGALDVALGSLIPEHRGVSVVRESKEERDERERSRLSAALRDAGGSYTAAARILGCSRGGVRTKIARLLA